MMPIRSRIRFLRCHPRPERRSRVGEGDPWCRSRRWIPFPALRPPGMTAASRALFQIGIGYRRRGFHVGCLRPLPTRAHVDDLRAGEAGEHRLYERVAGGVALALALERLALF